MTATYLLDSWAIMAYLKKESPADLRVVELLEQAQQGKTRLVIPVINLGEVFYIIGRVRGEAFAEKILAQLRSFPIEVLSLDDEIVFSAARWKMKHPISYADAFAAATAKQYNAILVTGDPELIALQGKLDIDVLQRG